MVGLLATRVSQAAVLISGLYNTGVNDAGQVLPLQSQELHYSVSGATTMSYVVPKVSQWVAAPSGSAWIGPNPTASNWPLDPTGMYYYKLSFSLSAVEASNLQISGLWSGDDTSEIWVNNQYTGLHIENWGAFVNLNHFLLQGQFVEGMNTLEFRVLNVYQAQYPNGNPTGLLVAGLSAEVVPEPATATLVGLGIASLVVFRRRR